MCGWLRVGKDFFHVCSVGRCSHVFGLLVRHTRPLAIMPSADLHLVRAWAADQRLVLGQLAVGDNELCRILGDEAIRRRGLTALQ
jgi:hypothetical protein